MKILLAIDGSDCSNAAVQEVASRPWPKGSEVRVLSAYEPPMPPTPEGWALSPDYFEEMDAALRKQADEVVKGTLGKLTGNDSFVAAATVICGPPRTVILDEAKDWGADLIVMGSHGYGAWSRFLLGSVSQGVVSHAKCSVEIVRASSTENGPKNE